MLFVAVVCHDKIGVDLLSIQLAHFKRSVSLVMQGEPKQGYGLNIDSSLKSITLSAIVSLFGILSFIPFAKVTGEPLSDLPSDPSALLGGF